MQNVISVKLKNKSDPRKLQLSNDNRDVLCQKFMFGGVEGGAASIKDMMLTGLSRREVFLDVLRPVANHLGTLWLEDRASFVSVRVASMRIEALLREFARPVSPLIVRRKRQAIFANVPGEEHTIGVQLAAELQRAKGWDIQLAINTGHAELLSEIKSSPAEILGLSIGSRSSIHGMYSLVRALRQCRPDMKILISGGLVTVEERPVKYIGADAYTDNFERAEILLDSFLDRPPNTEIGTGNITILGNNAT